MSGEERSDTELLAAHVSGDRGAFGALAARHGRQLWWVASRTLNRADDAEDAVQEALLSAFRRAHTFRGDASVRTWLHRIVVNTCIDRLRREQGRRTVALTDVEHQVTGHPEPVDVATRLVVDDALAALPVEFRVAVVLVDMEGWAVSEVAHVLEVPVGTVKSRCARGRAKLAVLLGHLREETG